MEFSICSKKEKKKEVDITILHLTKLQKMPKNKNKNFSSLIQEPSGYMNQHLVGASPRIKWIYEPTFGGQG
jgi:hypothetical protein